MKKIGIFFPLYEYGGVQTCVISLIKGLNQKGIIPYIIWEKEPDSKILEENKIIVKFEKVKFTISRELINKMPNSIRYLLVPFTQIKASDLKNNYDFIYLFNHTFLNDLNINYFYFISGPPFLPQLLPQKGISKLRYKLFEKIYKLFIKPFAPVYEFHYDVEKCSMNSKYTADMFYEAYNKNIEVIYPSNFIEKNNQLGFKNREGVLFLSRIIPYKRPQLLFELAKKYKDLNFYIVGSVNSQRQNYLNELKELKNKNGLNNINFIINKDYKIVKSYLSKCKYYVFPAKDEHFGITTVEAIMNGLIPFVHNSGGQREIIDLESFRFDDEEFIEKFNTIYTKTDDELINIQKYFYEHSDNFSENTFIYKLLSKMSFK